MVSESPEYIDRFESECMPKDTGYMAQGKCDLDQTEEQIAKDTVICRMSWILTSFTSEKLALIESIVNACDKRKDNDFYDILNQAIEFVESNIRKSRHRSDQFLTETLNRHTKLKD